jgi:hypothetical protein
LLYAASVSSLSVQPRFKSPEGLEVAIPPLIQVPLAAGDRYLAANIEVFRAMIVGAEVRDPGTFKMLGIVQKGAALLNPAHEDNYYISQAILPWNGQVEADIFIQKAATSARPWDSLPPFFLGFDHFYFLRDPLTGSRIIKVAAERSPPGNREGLMAMSARWAEKGDDPRTAIVVIEALAKNTRNQELKAHLEARLERLKGLAELRDHAKLFAEKQGRPLKRLEELVEAGLLSALPKDPLGEGYTLDTHGTPTVAKPLSAKTNAK